MYGTVRTVVWEEGRRKAPSYPMRQASRASRLESKPLTHSIARHLGVRALAVNGAVEAARAGEFGKGFAVVSTDIQNLANDAAENAEQIKDLVKAIQDQIAIVRTDLMSIAESSMSEVEKAKASTDALVAIARDMSAVVGNNKKIADAAQEIAASVAQAKTGME